MSPSPRPYSITIIHGSHVETRRIEEEVVKIGRLQRNQIFLDGEKVARMHAIIENSPTEVRVLDLGSSIGTYVNGERIEKSCPLKDGDLIKVADFELRYEVLDLEEPDPHPPKKDPPPFSAWGPSRVRSLTLSDGTKMSLLAQASTKGPQVVLENYSTSNLNMTAAEAEMLASNLIEAAKSARDKQSSFIIWKATTTPESETTSPRTPDAPAPSARLRRRRSFRRRHP